MKRLPKNRNGIKGMKAFRMKLAGKGPKIEGEKKVKRKETKDDEDKIEPQMAKFIKKNSATLPKDIQVDNDPISASIEDRLEGGSIWTKFPSTEPKPDVFKLKLKGKTAKM